MDQEPLHELFLADEPTLEQRWRALSLNMQAWFERRVLAGDGEVAREGGMLWTYAPMEESNITISAFDTLQGGEQVDRVLAWYRQRRPLRGGLCWYLAATPPGDLGARLFARGFEPNWQPHWMWLELRSMDRSNVRSATFDIRIVEDESVSIVGAGLAPARFPQAGSIPQAESFPRAGRFPQAGRFPRAGSFPQTGSFPRAGSIPRAGRFPRAGSIPRAGASPAPTIPTDDDLPYYSAKEAAIIAALYHIHPRRVWHLVAFQGQQVVGRCVLNVTDGEWGVAGLFSMGVVPAARKQGIGTALILRACELAERIGCRHVVLNATEMGKPVYRRVGFQSLGYGHSWCFRKRALAAPAPTRERVMLLEAIGRGDITTLNEMSKYIEKEAFNEPLPSGLTALDIAVRCQHPASADWLVEHGVQLDLISACELGWKERIPGMLAEQPELVNVRRGDWQLTPLHVAVERDDIELVRLLLTVPNDLEIKDTQFQATALGWAQFFRRTEMIELIEQHKRDPA
jgi:GNAT superfamily N-acetyltransferase